MSIHFAILGAGHIGQVHARAVAGNDQAVFAAVFDPVEAADASVAECYGAEIRDLGAIAAAVDIDAPDIDGEFSFCVIGPATGGRQALFARHEMLSLLPPFGIR